MRWYSVMPTNHIGMMVTPQLSSCCQLMFPRLKIQGAVPPDAFHATYASICDGMPIKIRPIIRMIHCMVSV
jgi:hypothetical protein